MFFKKKCPNCGVKNPIYAKTCASCGAPLALRQAEGQIAIKDFDEAIRLNTKDVEAYIRRSFAYYNKGDLDRAIADYDKAIELDPNYAKAIEIPIEYTKAYYNKGNAYADKGEVAKAINSFEKFIELSDDLVMVAVAQQILDELRQ